jgi:hypothetical protein
MKAERSVERSIDSLQRIYAVVVGLAINEGIKRFFLANNNQFELPITNWPQFIAFMVTIIPFLHGMNRHLDRTLVEAKKPGKRWKLTFLLIDFGFFIGESCFFVSLAATVTKHEEFFYLLLWLLLADAIWAFVTLPITHAFSGRWMLINAITCAGIAYVLFWDNQIRQSWKPLLLCGIAILRTILDYRLVWSFYFPPDDSPTSPTKVHSVADRRITVEISLPISGELRVTDSV